MVGVGVIVGVGVGVGIAAPDISIKLLSLNSTSILFKLPYPDTTCNAVGESKYPLPGLVTMIAESEKLAGIKEADTPTPLPFMEVKAVGDDTNPEPELIITKDGSVSASALKVVENPAPFPEEVILLGLDTKPEPESIIIKEPLVNVWTSETMLIAEPVLSKGVARVGEEEYPVPELIMTTEDVVNSSRSNIGCTAIGELLIPPTLTTGVESKPEPASSITKPVILPLPSTPVIFIIAGDELPPPVTNNSCPLLNPVPPPINPAIELEVIPPASVREKWSLLPTKVVPLLFPLPVSTEIPVGDPVNP